MQTEIEATYNPDAPTFTRIYAQTLLMEYLRNASEIQAAQRDKERKSQSLVLRAPTDSRLDFILSGDL